MRKSGQADVAEAKNVEKADGPAHREGCFQCPGASSILLERGTFSEVEMGSGGYFQKMSLGQRGQRPVGAITITQGRAEGLSWESVVGMERGWAENLSGGRTDRSQPSRTAGVGEVKGDNFLALEQQVTGGCQ